MANSNGFSTSVTFDGDDMRQVLHDLGVRDLPRIATKALRGISIKIRQANRDEMKDVFNNPTKYTISAVGHKVTGNTDTWDFGAVVYLKEQTGQRQVSDHFLYPQIFGDDQRGLKNFEYLLQQKGAMPQGYYAVPGSGMPLDAYGNPPRGEIVKILSWLQAFQDGGYRANVTDDTRARRRRATNRRMGEEYFAVADSSNNLAMGVYKRIIGGLGNRVVCLFKFVRWVNYEERFQFYGLSAQTFKDDWAYFVQDAINHELAAGRSI